MDWCHLEDRAGHLNQKPGAMLNLLQAKQNKGSLDHRFPRSPFQSLKCTFLMQDAECWQIPESREECEVTPALHIHMWEPAMWRSAMLKHHHQRTEEEWQ